MSGHVEALFQIAPHLAHGCKPSANHVMIRCPLHGGGQEKTPSCAVSTYKPVWFCHGCKESGHIAQLLRHFGMPRELIDVVVPKDGSNDWARTSKSVAAKIARGESPFSGYYVLSEEILDAYRIMPPSLVRAGFEEPTLRHFEVGYDDKNVRITYPLRTAFGDLVGISGRTIFEGIEPRYRIYDKELTERKDFGVPANYTVEEVKSAILWHAHVCRPLFFVPSSGKAQLIVTEGFKACMWVWQSGWEDVVALVGSYLTDTHAELIARATRRVLLFLDNNEAGYLGTLRAGRVLLNKGCEVCVASYPDKREQPDDLSSNEIFDAVNDQQPFLHWKQAHRMPEPLKKWAKR